MLQYTVIRVALLLLALLWRKCNYPRKVFSCDKRSHLYSGEQHLTWECVLKEYQFMQYYRSKEWMRYNCVFLFRFVLFYYKLSPWICTNFRFLSNVYKQQAYRNEYLHSTVCILWSSVHLIYVAKYYHPAS